jgi:hypothetical protein
MIVVSCIFSTIEQVITLTLTQSSLANPHPHPHPNPQSCEDDVEVDESFQYMVDTMEFELPKVRCVPCF